MKKLILALVAACCTAGMLRAQDVVPADTLKAQPVVATVESQPVVEEKAETPKEPKEFKGRRKYFNIGYAWEKLDAVDYPSKEESELAAFLTWGKTFYLHKKPIANMLKIGLDFTWMDITYARYDIESWEESTDEWSGMRTFYEVESDMHRIDYGMHLGPSVTVNPVSALCVNAYFRYAPTFAMSLTQSDGWDMGYGYASLFVTGAAVSYKAISLGIEYRFGNTKMNVLSLDPDGMEVVDEDLGALEGVGDLFDEMFSSAEKTKYKLKDLRLYISFRF